MPQPQPQTPQQHAPSVAREADALDAQIAALALTEHQRDAVYDAWILGGLPGAARVLAQYAPAQDVPPAPLDTPAARAVECRAVRQAQRATRRPRYAARVRV